MLNKIVFHIFSLDSEKCRHPNISRFEDNRYMQLVPALFYSLVYIAPSLLFSLVDIFFYLAEDNLLSNLEGWLCSVNL